MVPLKARDAMLAAVILALTWTPGLLILLAPRDLAITLMRIVVGAGLALIGLLAAASILGSSTEE